MSSWRRCTAERPAQGTFAFKAPDRSYYMRHAHAAPLATALLVAGPWSLMRRHRRPSAHHRPRGLSTRSQVQADYVQWRPELARWSRAMAAATRRATAATARRYGYGPRLRVLRSELRAITDARTTGYYHGAAMRLRRASSVSRRARSSAAPSPAAGQAPDLCGARTRQCRGLLRPALPVLQPGQRALTAAMTGCGHPCP